MTTKLEIFKLQGREGIIYKKLREIEKTLNLELKSKIPLPNPSMFIKKKGIQIVRTK